MSETKQTADIIIVLDESGSMSSMGDEPVQAMNEFIQDQKKTDPDGLLSLYTFATKSRVVYKNKKLSEFEEYSDYTPSGMTALYDTIKLAISDKMSDEKERHNNNILVIITDGQNNSSDTSLEEVKSLIKKQEEEHKWQVIFLAANQDAFQSGVSYGCSQARCGNFSQDKKGDLLNVVRQASYNISAYKDKVRQNNNVDIIELNLEKED